MKTRTIREYIKEYFDKNIQRLSRDYPGIRLERFLDEYCSYDNSNPDDEFFMENPGFLEKIRLGTPLEYINFKKFFYNQEFYVNPNVLIPRSETEILCEKAIEFINENYHENFSIYDIGTGSGIIPLTLATEVKKRLLISACDISAEALEVSKINYDNLFNQIPNETRINFEIRDRLEGLNEKFDLITSNPPYIKEVKDKDLVHHQADMFEPKIALYLKDEEYDEWFINLFKQVSNCLKENGLFIMEGHENSLKSLELIALKYFKYSSIINDYTHRERFLVCKK